DRNGDRPVTLAVTVDGELVATVVADLPLASLPLTDRGTTTVPPAGSPANCGFRLDFPPHLLGGRARDVVVTVAGDGFRLSGTEAPVPFPVVWLAEGTAASAADAGTATGPEGRPLRVVFGV